MIRTKVLAAFIALCLLAVPMYIDPEACTQPAISAHAEESGTCGANLTWTLDDTTGTLTISGTGPMTDYETPTESPFFAIRDRIKAVAFEPGITSIGAYAFFFCDQLTNVKLPDNVTSIEKGAFRQCTRMTTVTFPANLTSIGEEAFSSCDSLLYATIPAKVTSISDSAFYGCDSLVSATIPSGVTRIQEWVFGECHNLTTVSIPNSVTRIEWHAFCGCTNLSSVNIPDNVTWIEAGAFESCKSLSKVTIPASVEFIGNSAFGICTSLTAVNVAADNPKYLSLNGVLFTKDKTLLHCYPAGKTGAYTIPDGVTDIGYNAFRECAGLTSVTIPDSVKTIDYSAFMDCKNLKLLEGGKRLNTISTQAFCGCTNLPDVVLPESVETIAYRAFHRCAGVNSVTILNPKCNIDPTENTFSNSTFGFTGIIYGYEGSTAQSYAKEFNRRFIALSVPATGLRGDVNANKAVDAEDAALLLSYAAGIGAGVDPVLFSAQDEAAEQNARRLADVNESGTIDAADAASILIYAAITGTTGGADWDAILGN